jgi:hypothetical protein
MQLDMELTVALDKLLLKHSEKLVLINSFLIFKAQGLQSAFDQAQKSQQFGVTTGLQGLQAGISGAQTGIQGAGMLQGLQASQAGYEWVSKLQALGQLATQQQQADLTRLGFQREIGDVQQQRQQQIINQAVQDYALSQEMPMQRLAGYSALASWLCNAYNNNFAISSWR